MAGHGGGAWKVAYADFVTAMMAFFLVMWILAQGKPVKTAVAEYFRDPYGSSKRPTNAPFSSMGPNDGSSIQSLKAPTGWGKLPGDSPLPNTGSIIKRKPTRTEDDKEGTITHGKRRERIVVHKTDEAKVIGGLVEFDGDTSQLSEPQTARLKTIAGDMTGKLHRIEVLGHISHRPLAPESPYKNRWELAFARCCEVAKELEAMKIERKRLRLVISDQAGQPGQKFAPQGRLDGTVEVYLTDIVARDSKAAPDAAVGSGAE